MRVRWGDCEGLVGSVEAPRASVESRIPDAYTARGYTSETATVLFEALECDRTVYDNRSRDLQALFQVLARVEPTNETWSPDAPSFYLLDLLVTDADLAARLAGIGLPALVTVLERTLQELPEGGSLQQWRFDAGNRSVRLEYGARGGEGARFQDVYRFWHGPAPTPVRTENQKSAAYDAAPIEGGLLRVQGPLELAATLGGLAWIPWIGQAYAGDNEHWTVAPLTRIPQA